jgi:type III secretion protein T
MDVMDSFNQALTGFGYVVPRIGAAFIVLPLMTSDIVPALVRNVLIAAIALNVFPIVATTIDTNAISAISLPGLITKEIFIGVLIGFTFGMMFWAIEMAGQIIDTKIGSTTAQIVDPLQGHQTSLTGSMLGRFAAWLFVATGGLLIFMDVLLTSYTVWPVAQMLPPLKLTGSEFVIARSRELLVLACLLAAPALVLMTLIDLGLGLMNRFAQQLNVFQLSMPIKAAISIWVILLMLGTVADYTLEHLNSLRSLLKDLSQTI